MSEVYANKSWFKLFISKKGWKCILNVYCTVTDGTVCSANKL